MENNATLLPADIYQVVNKCLLNEHDKLVLSMLYMPIIGNVAISLYESLYNELKANSYISVELTHHHLMTNLGISLKELKEARMKLEGIGLLKTYYMEGSINSYIYELYSPISASEFFSHPIFNMVLYNNLGKEEYDRVVNYFKMPSINLKGYTDITTPFDMTFKSKNYTNYEIENEEIIKKEKSKLNYFYDFDFDLLISSMPKNLFNIKTLNKINKELIRDLVFLYELDPYSMSELVKSSLNESGMIDKEELRKNVRKYYQYNNSNKLPSLIFKSQPDYLMSPKGDNSPRGKMIKVFETISPYKFLKSKNNGVKPSERDMKVLESLLVDFKLNPAVVNVLVDYTLRINNNKLTKNYIETIASQWKRLKIETAKEAMEQAEKEYKKYKKSSIKESIKKKDVLPSWFNKEIKKEELTEEERREFEELVKEFK